MRRAFVFRGPYTVYGLGHSLVQSNHCCTKTLAQSLRLSQCSRMIQQYNPSCNFNGTQAYEGVFATNPEASGTKPRSFVMLSAFVSLWLLHCSIELPAVEECDARNDAMKKCCR